MKKKVFCILAAAILGVGVVVSGCSKEPQEDVEGMILNSIKTEPEDFSELLEKGIGKMNGEDGFILQFPEELKEPYLEFLNTAFLSIKLEVSSVDEKEDGNYSARMSFAPLDLQENLETETQSYMTSMQSTDLTEAVAALLEKDAVALKDVAESPDIKVLDIQVTKEDSYSVSEEDIQELIKASLVNYMSPYETVTEVLDTRDFLQSYLDAIYKGEFAQFMKHTGMTEEEAREWYEGEGRFSPPEDIDQQYSERCTAAYKSIFRQSKYQVGIPRKVEEVFHYMMEVTVTPNLSLENVGNEFTSGTYNDINSASAALVESLEKYAAAPSYGEETAITVDLNLSSLLAGDEDSDLYRLVSEICPIPE